MLTPLIQHSTEALANAIRRKKKIKGTQTAREETKLPYVEMAGQCAQSPEESTSSALEAIRVRRVTGYKRNTTVFLWTSNERMETN